MIAVPTGLVKVIPPTAPLATGLPTPTRTPMAVFAVGQSRSTEMLPAFSVDQVKLLNTVPAVLHAYDV